MPGRGSRSSSSSELDGVELEDRDPRRKTKKAERERKGRARSYQMNRALRILRVVGFVALGGVALGALVVGSLFIVFGLDPKLPKIEKVGDYHPKQVTRVLDREGKPLGEIGAERRTLVPFEKIPKVFLDAVVAAEDPSFYEHQGLDYRGILRAAIENLFEGRFAQGGSTITQQVVKQMLLSPEKTLKRKVQELILARRISEKLSKNEILEIYVNQNNYGQARYGCEEAARYYFGKSIGDVTLGEAALLAGLPQSPERLSPRRHPEAAKRRQMYVLGQMSRLGYVSRADAERMAAQPIQVIPEPPGRSSVAPEAVATITRRLAESYGDRLGTLGATVKSTIDLKLQELARQSLERGLEELDARQGYRGPSGHLTGTALERHRKELTAAHAAGIKDSEIVDGIVVRADKSVGAKGRLFVDLGGREGFVDLALETRYALGPKPLVDRFKPGDLVRVRLAMDRKHDANQLPLALELGPQAAMVVMDPLSRDVLALVGGYNYRPGGFDRAQRAQLQPGSAFKPFLYAAAIESGRYTAASIVNDAPEVYDLWKPQNYERESFRGPVRLRTALAHSINTVAIKLLADVTLPVVRDVAHRMGLTAELPDSLGLSAALGSGVVTPIELANAYCTFPGGGQRADFRLIQAVGDEPSPPANLQPAIRPETAYVMVSVMRSVVDEGTARMASSRIHRPIAGKTGTSNDLKDAWFAGFSPDLLAVVWVGFDDRKKLGKGEAGARTALPIWVEFMSKALAARPTRDFPQPPGVVVTQIDPTTGLRAPPGAEGIAEVFVAGTEPKEQAPVPGDLSSPDKILLEGN